ncbi:MAG: hypothetical protein OES79_15545 [Planctomycetota bacterium]|nr:hypothetical protein [Planctomycetota bacterium]
MAFRLLEPQGDFFYWRVEKTRSSSPCYLESVGREQAKRSSGKVGIQHPG